MIEINFNFELNFTAVTRTLYVCFMGNNAAYQPRRALRAGGCMRLLSGRCRELIRDPQELRHYSRRYSES